MELRAFRRRRREQPTTAALPPPSQETLLLMAELETAGVLERLGDRNVRMVSDPALINHGLSGICFIFLLWLVFFGLYRCVRDAGPGSDGRR